MVFDKGLKLDLVSTNSIIGRLTLQIYWCRWAFAAIPHGQQRQKKGTHELCNKHFHCGCRLFSSSQKVHGTIFWILFFWDVLFSPRVSSWFSVDWIVEACWFPPWNHRSAWASHGLPMGSSAPGLHFEGWQSLGTARDQGELGCPASWNLKGEGSRKNDEKKWRFRF